MHRYANKHGRLPLNLNLQMDNTNKDNKNRFVLSFLAWLVSVGLFKTVNAYCLGVGHTHEDVDRFFSRVSVSLSAFSERNMEEHKQWGVETIGDLKQAILDSHHPRPSVHTIEEVWDWKSFLSPVSEASIKGSMSNRAFRFDLSDAGHVQVNFRPWMVPPDSLSSSRSVTHSMISVYLIDDPLFRYEGAKVV